MRRFLRPIFCATLRVFFRRIEVLGRERVPRDGPVIFALNHPNALIDPLFLVCRAPRTISFLAKAPLFHMPVIGFFVRAFESLPVYRRQDEGDPRRNRETFERASALLARDRAIAMFPEGTSHSEPRLKPLKSGTARLALGAAAVAAESGASTPLRIVPAGLYYTAKGAFRSAALLYFGEPIPVESQGLGPDGNPPGRAVRELTSRIERALADVTLQAEQEEALELIGRAAALFSANGERPGTHPDLAAEFELRRRFLAGYAALSRRDPERLAAIRARLLRYERELRSVGLGGVAGPMRRRTQELALLTARRLGKTLLLLPVGLVGSLLHYGPYRLAGFLATRYADTEDVIATVKALAALLCFPAAWLVCATAAGLAFGPAAALAALVLVPLSGYVALLLVETAGELAAAARALVLFVLRPRAVARLADEGRALRDEILRLRRLVEPP